MSSGEVKPYEEPDYTINEHLMNITMFMNAGKQVVSDKIRTPSSEERILRAKLIYEECMETIHALGVDFIMGKFLDAGEKHYNPKEVLDGVADIAVVANGTILCCGLGGIFSEALLRVDQNNKSKVFPKAYFREDGKLLKPPDYVPVVLDDLIERVK